MPAFSERSKGRLATCDIRLQQVMYRVVEGFDITILQGFRTEAEQTEAFNKGMTKVRWPYSKHNSRPAMAVDIAPWKKTEPHIDWKDLDLFRTMGGYVLGVAFNMGIKLRWGGDWDMDWEFKDQSFIDMPHFELVE